MGKGDKRGRKARQKWREAVAGMELPPVKVDRPARNASGQFSADPDPQAVVLAARARQQGVPLDRDEMRATAYGEAAGQALVAAKGQDAGKALFAVYADLTRSYAIYLRYYISKRIHAKTAKIEMMPETIETRADDRPDLRTEDDRAADALRSWREGWGRRFNALSKRDRVAIRAVWYGWAAPMDAGRLTGAGARFAAAMERLSDE